MPAPLGHKDDHIKYISDRLTPQQTPILSIFTILPLQSYNHHQNEFHTSIIYNQAQNGTYFASLREVLSGSWGFTKPAFMVSAIIRDATE